MKDLKDIFDMKERIEKYLQDLLSEADYKENMLLVSHELNGDVSDVELQEVTLRRRFAKEVMSLLKSENTECVSTTSLDESCVSHDVSERNASRSDSTEDPEVVVEGALALRTKPESVQCHNPLGCACFEANGWQDTGCDYWHA